MEVSRDARTLNFPNVLTVIRLFLAIALPFLWISSWLGWNLIGGALFAVGAITDYLDGRLARRYQQITTFGKIVDPIADKMLTLGAFATLSYVNVFPFWLIIPIIFRELLITILRFYFLFHGTAVAAVTSGKQKMTLQIGAIIIGYLKLLFREHMGPTLAAQTESTLLLLINILLYTLLVAALYQTLYSGYDFLRNNWKLLRPA